MKQTLEEAAIKAAEDCYEMPYDENLINMRLVKQAVEYGAKWQAKQPLWISIEERLPEDTSEKLIMLVDGTIRIAHYDEDYNEDMEYHFWYDCAASESYHRDDVIYWMPIPSFDEILEANRDVLERIKEKGD